VNTLKTVFDHQDLLRASISSASNALRLGANEAPPTVFSVFLGSEVSKMLALMEEAVVERKMTPDEKTALKLNIGRIPEIILDSTDRNRTSPFAFSGNRFEFRAVGSSANCAAALISLNTAMAAQLEKFRIEVDQLIEKGTKKDEAIFQVLKRLIIESKPISFDGNGYSPDWVKEAKKRGLSNVTSAPQAISAYLKKESVRLFAEQDVMTLKELESRVEVEYEKFTKKVQIESRVIGDLAINHIVPTAMEYETRLLANVKSLKDVFPVEEFKILSGERMNLIREIEGHITAIKVKVYEMTEARKKANIIQSTAEKAHAYEDSVLPFLEEIRSHIDQLELSVDNNLWPLPKYRELLFIR
jgi:glutamine synthetase